MLGLFCSSNQRSDIDECRNASLNECSHTCINTNGSYNCLCPSELALSNDGVTCKSKLILSNFIELIDIPYIVSDGVLSGSILGGLGIFAVTVAAVIILAYTCPKCIKKLRASMDKTKHTDL